MMKTAFLVFLAICSLTAAMIPRYRRALPAEEDPPSQPSSAHSEKVRYCAPQTPCSWIIYKPISKLIDVNITNEYCICSPGMHCVETEDDTTANAYVFKCRAPSATQHTVETTTES